MPAIHETAYPRTKPNLSPKKLKKLFTPNEEELILLDCKTKKSMPVTRFGFMLMLKCYQYLGRPVKLKTIDVSIKNFVAEKIGIDPLIDLSGYSKLTRHRHTQSIRDFLEINADKKERRNMMKKVALTAATNKENLADIINCVIDELVKARFELPAFQKLVRLGRAARTVINNGNYQILCLPFSRNEFVRGGFFLPSLDGGFELLLLFLFKPLSNSAILAACCLTISSNAAILAKSVDIICS